MFKQILIFVGSIFSSSEAFHYLQDARTYANQHTEIIIPDSFDASNPEYTSWFKKQHSYSFNPFVAHNRLDSTYFKESLEVIMHKKEYKEPFSYAIAASSGARFFIWGSLFGSFHSLVRGLIYLEQEGILDNAFSLLQRDHYLVFNGNVLSGSPYVIELVALIVALMKANPNCILYIAGKQEASRVWKHTGFGTLLPLLKSIEPSLLDRFFDSLPRALFITDTTAKTKFIRISPDIPTSLSEGLCIPSAKNSVQVCPITGAQERFQTLVNVFIRNEERMVSYNKYAGLMPVEPEQGATTWSIFSAPNYVYKKYYQFVYDAFTILALGSSFYEGTLTLYNRNVEGKSEFALVTRYNVLTGKVVLSKKDEKPAAYQEPIILGSTLDLSKSVRGLGLPMRIGMALRINKQNREGGVNGKYIKMVFLDDGYIPVYSQRNINKLLSVYHTPFLLCPVGSPTLQRSLDLIREKKIAVLFPQSGSPLFRNPALSNIVNFRASFVDEGKLLTQYVLKEYIPKRIAFFYQDDSFGLSSLQGAEEALQKFPKKKIVNVPYTAHATNFKDQAQKIRKVDPDVIAFFATGTATLQLIRDLGVEFLTHKVLYAVSSVGDEVTIKTLTDKGISMIFGHVVPNPKTSTLPIVKEYREELARYGYKEDQFSLEAYIVTSITIDNIARVKGSLTPKKLIQEIESVKDYTFHGLKLNFNATTRTLARSLWIETEEGIWIEKNI